MLQSVKFDEGVERHEEVFLARYGRLRAWALQLTGGDRGPAEDLVQDAYVHFTFARPDLERITNLDGYLYTMLRNLQRSQMRRAERLEGRGLPILEYDSAETTLRAAGERDRLRVQDELRQVCAYACARKESSKAGSVLILRFIHGYYPREIASVVRGTRASVEERLRVARGEAAQYLKNPESLRFIREAPRAQVRADAGTALPLPADEFLTELRRAVFESRRGACAGEEALRELYRAEDAEGLDAPTLAHLVSCTRCMDEVNQLLGLPPLSERYPTDTLGNDTRRGGGDGGDGRDGGGTSGGGEERALLRRLRRRAGDVFEHRPQQLRVSVNGRLLAAQKVNADLSEQTLSLDAGESVEFVEVFSEQEVRLLFLSLDGGSTAHALSSAR
ncbi:MAG TPA: RNA polymerase sigma factor, partial [Pyrinomonadaceae bacterium]|nr:RNA polymerase sigma factor [Pyrinomonadaceae bacterium]